MPQTATKSRASWDADKFRLRRLVDRLADMDEVQVHDEPVALSELSPIIENTTKAVLFRKAGPERHEVAAAVSATRKRLAAAFEVPEEKMREEYMRRMANPHKSFEVPSGDAPVHQVVITGDQIDLTKLPFHVQHEYDGAPYISSGIDFTVDPATKRSNVGCRRLMLRGKDKAGFNLTAPSDLRQIYLGCVARGEKLQASFTIGAHPLDTMAAASRGTGQEIDRLATYRGEPLPVVKCLTNDLYVPADAEIVLEGYVDERGYIDPEGPYGEYMGYYGPMHGDPVFHVTAITQRRDVLHQSIKHGIGRKLSECDGAPMGHVQAEARAWELLSRSGLDPVDIWIPDGPGVGAHMRVSIRKRTDGDARAAIAILLGSMVTLKHVYIVDDDIDVRSSAEVEWAMASRFQADKGIVVMSNMQCMPMDLSAPKRGIGAKAGFDLTFPYPRSKSITMRVPEAPKIGGPARFQTVAQALEGGPMHFARLMSVLGSRDGREIVLEIERLRDAGVLDRNEEGEYYLKKS
ncbi:MAG TPA: UbiD family decarboxylase [Stellaceae bacterium]|nr:UbiD family decarboxylase [Stellaceae bacterium]